VENSLHWVIDMIFRDDECHVRTDHAPANFTTLKHMAHNLIRRAPGKDSLRLRRKVAAWDEEFLVSLVTGWFHPIPLGMAPVLNEQSRRRFVALEAQAMGRGGVSLMARISVLRDPPFIRACLASITKYLHWAAGSARRVVGVRRKQSKTLLLW
jgi:hypothetical protein